MISGFWRCRGTVCLEVELGMIFRANVGRRDTQDRGKNNMCLW